MGGRELLDMVPEGKRIDLSDRQLRALGKDKLGGEE